MELINKSDSHNLKLTNVFLQAYRVKQPRYYIKLTMFIKLYLTEQLKLQNRNERGS